MFAEVLFSKGFTPFSPVLHPRSEVATGSNPQLALRRRLLYPFNYENECRIFGLFSLFGIGNHIYESNHSRDELPLFLILTSQAPLLESNSKFIPFSFQRVQPWLNLRSSSPYRKHISFSVNLSQGKS